MKAPQPLEPKGHQFDSCGLWPLASYINHSCYSNASRSFIGDMMVVRATRDLAPNTEITFWYQPPTGQQVNLEAWGFKCNCVICREIKNPRKSNIQRRERLQIVLNKAFDPEKTRTVDEIDKVLTLLAETYRQPATEVPRIILAKPYWFISQYSLINQQSQKAIEFALKSFESLGYIIEGGRLPHIPGIPLIVRKWGLMMDHLVGCWMCLSRAYREAAPDLEIQAEGYARITYKICVGEDETFDETYGRDSTRTDGLY